MSGCSHPCTRMPGMTKLTQRLATALEFAAGLLRRYDADTDKVLVLGGSGWASPATPSG